MIARVRSTVVAAVAVVLIASAGAGCGDTSCEDAAASAMNAMGMGGSRYGRDKARAIKACKDDKWSASLRGCLAGARTRSAVDKCMTADRAGGRRYGGGR